MGFAETAAEAAAELDLREPAALLPTTMVGSYPRPHWFRYQLDGRDILDAFKYTDHAEAFSDATRAVIIDQELAGLDIVTDGQMWFDDRHMGIGAFFWYWFERIPGFGREMMPHPGRARANQRDLFLMDEAGSAVLRGEVGRGPLRLAELYRLAQSNATRPVKASVGAGPCQLSSLVQYESGPLENRYQLSEALAEVFQAELVDLSDAGCRYIQYEDLGAWLPNLTGEKDIPWVVNSVNKVLDGAGSGVRTAWHFCMGNAWGNRLEAMIGKGYEAVLPWYGDVHCHEFTLDFACREMADAHLLAQLPEDKDVSIGVIDVRSLEIEHPEQVAERVRSILTFITPERVTLTTDCGLRQLPRPVAVAKLRALVAGAAIVRRELTGE